MQDYTNSRLLVNTSLLTRLASLYNMAQLAGYATGFSPNALPLASKKWSPL
jgi:hypothetical protein